MTMAMMASGMASDAASDDRSTAGDDGNGDDDEDDPIVNGAERDHRLVRREAAVSYLRRCPIHDRSDGDTTANAIEPEDLFITEILALLFTHSPEAVLQLLAAVPKLMAACDPIGLPLYYVRSGGEGDAARVYWRALCLEAAWRTSLAIIERVATEEAAEAED